MIIRNPYAKKNKARPTISDRPLFAPNANDSFKTNNYLKDSQIESETNGVNDNDSKPAAVPTSIKPFQSPAPLRKPVSIELPNWKRLPSSQIVSAELISVTELLQHAKLFCGKPVRLLCAKFHGLATPLSDGSNSPSENTDSLPTTWVHVEDPLASFLDRKRPPTPARATTTKRIIIGKQMERGRTKKSGKSGVILSGQGRGSVTRIAHGVYGGMEARKRQSFEQIQATPLHSKAIRSNPYASGRPLSNMTPQTNQTPTSSLSGSNTKILGQRRQLYPVISPALTTPNVLGSVRRQSTYLHQQSQKPSPERNDDGSLTVGMHKPVVPGRKPPPGQSSSSSRTQPQTPGYALKKPPPTPQPTATGATPNTRNVQSPNLPSGAKRVLPNISNPYLRQSKRPSIDSAGLVHPGSISSSKKPSIRNGSLSKKIKVKTKPRPARLSEASARLANAQRMVSQNVNTALKRRTSLPAPRPLPKSVSTAATSIRKKQIPQKAKKSCLGKTRAKSLRVSFVPAVEDRKQPLECLVKLDHAVSWVNTSLGAFTSGNSSPVTIIGTVKSDGQSLFLDARVVRQIPSTSNLALDHRILLQRRQFLYSTRPATVDSETETLLSKNQGNASCEAKAGYLPGCGPPPYPPRAPA